MRRCFRHIGGGGNPADHPLTERIQSLPREATTITRASRQANRHHAAHDDIAGSDHDLFPRPNRCLLPPFVDVMQQLLRFRRLLSHPAGAPAAQSGPSHLVCCCAFRNNHRLREFRTQLTDQSPVTHSDVKPMSSRTQSIPRCSTYKCMY